MKVRAEVELPIEYDGFRIEAGYRLDLIVEELVIVEVKAIAALLPIHQAQLLSYLKLSKLPIGLLINFHVEHLRDGIRRIAN